MRYIVYLDVVAGVNFIMDMSVLWLTGFVLKYKLPLWRILLGGFTGSIMSVGLQLVHGIPLWLYYVLGIAGIGMGMTVITFPVHTWRQLLHSYGCLLLVTIGVGGSMTLLGHLVEQFQGQGGQLLQQTGTFWQLVVLSAVSITVLTLLWLGMRQYDVEHQWIQYTGLLTIDGVSQSGIGFLDTGNRLVEPVSHQPVVIVDPTWLMPALSEEYRTLVDVYVKQGCIDYDWIVAHQLYKVRRIPYQTIDEADGHLLGIQCQRLELTSRGEHRCYSPVMIGISRTAVSAGKKYQLIIPWTLCAGCR
jgi:stage II sporulation protein GA (sporulation sigma-E factor processing peptidase)